jgi:hypothetical protein
MRKSDDTPDAFNIPETAADFEEYEKDARTVSDLMWKWGWTRVQAASPDDGPVFVKPGSGRQGPFDRMRIGFYNEASPIRIMGTPKQST